MGDVMSQQSVRQAARRSAFDTQVALHKERADRERRLERLAVAVLTALGERDALVRDAERRARQALPTMTDDEGLSVLKAVDGAASASSAAAHLLGRPYGAGADAATADAKSGSTP